MEAAGDLVVYGPLGIMVMVLLSFSWWTIKRLVTDRERAEQRAHDLQEAIYREFAPALAAATRAIQDRSEYEDEVRDVMLDVRRLLEVLS